MENINELMKKEKILIDKIKELRETYGKDNSISIVKNDVKMLKLLNPLSLKLKDLTDSDELEEICKSMDSICLLLRENDVSYSNMIKLSVELYGLILIRVMLEIATKQVIYDLKNKNEFNESKEDSVEIIKLTDLFE